MADKSWENNSDTSMLQVDAEREPLLTWKQRVPKSHPVDYFVPNFGPDQDNVLTTNNSLRIAEGLVGRSWNYTPPTKEQKAGHPMNYFVPNFGIDEDIKITQNNIKSEEKRLKHEWKPVQDDNGVWIVPEAASNKSYTYRSAAQTTEPNLGQQEQKSDPICSSAEPECWKSKDKAGHPVDYFVPNFGLDHDIKTTL
jgi:hypothetical protein